MSYAGIRGDEARADMIAYLRSLADDPLPLPEAEAAPEGEPAPEAESGQGR
jgi:cytochrome c